jgi:exosortase/archaeosortase family protein
VKPVASSPSLNDRFIPLGIYGITLLVFYPVIAWLLQQTVAQDQLMHGFLVMLFTVALLTLYRRIKITPVLRFTDTAQNLLIMAYAVLVAAIFTKNSLIILASLCLTAASLLYFVFGRENRRLILTSVAAFALFTAFAVALPYLDWPLRRIAGACAAYGLGWTGTEAQLGLYHGSTEPMLLLFHEGRPFHVAAECNGFGTLTSVLLMALILLIYRKLSMSDRLLGLILALLTGFALNTLRIVIIVLLAPIVGADNYMLMHEVVGIVVTYGGLALVFRLAAGRENLPAAS